MLLQNELGEYFGERLVNGSRGVVVRFEEQCAHFPATGQHARAASFFAMELLQAKGVERG